MKKRNNLWFAISLLSVGILLSSCSKQATPIYLENETENAIRQIKKIIGEDGIIKVIDTNSYNLSNYKSESIIGTDNVRKLSIDEFRKVYKAFKTKQVSFEVVEEGRVDSNIKNKEIKSNSIIIGEDTYDEYDGDKDDGNGGPKPAGLYHSIFHSEILQYYRYGYIDGNNPTLFANLNVEFKSDQFGMIVGSPSISFSGVRMFSWNQTSTYPISSNKNNYTSSFYISGKAEFLLGIGNSVLGLGGNTTFKITINMDENSRQIVKIEIVDFKSL
jgi:hypothetical protein